MTSQGTAHGRFQRAICNRNLLNAEIAARELGELSLADAFGFCLLLAEVDPPRFDRALPARATVEGRVSPRPPRIESLSRGQTI